MSAKFIGSKVRYLSPLVTVAICIYALYLRLETLGQRNLWSDELYQLNLMKGSFINLLQLLGRFEHGGYLSGDYYLIYPFFKIFGYNKWGLAIPHFVATVLGFWLLYLICKRYLKTVWGYIITFSLVCFNATLICHATEIRRYAVLPTLALACFYLSLKLIDRKVTISIRDKIITGSVFVVTIWFHVYGILMVFLAVLFSLLIKGILPAAYSVFTKAKSESFDPIIRDILRISLIAVCIAAPLWLISVFGRHLSLPPGVDTFKYIPNPVKDASGFLKAIFGNLVGYKPLYFLLIGGIFPFILPHKERFLQILFVIIMIFIPLAMIFLADLKTNYWFLQRQFIWLMPFFAFFLGWSWDSAIVYLKGKTVKIKDV